MQTKVQATDLRSIAKLAGVSHSTVSRVINGKAHIADDTRERVLAVLRESGYLSRRRASRRLRHEKRRPFSVEVVLCQFSRHNETLPGGFQMQVLAGIQDFVEDYGPVEQHLSYWNETQHRGDVDTASLLRTCEQRDGVLLTGNPTPELVFALRKIGKAVVLADSEVEGTAVDSVLSDNVWGGRLAAQQLIAAGVERIGCLVTTPQYIPCKQRLWGIQMELMMHGLAMRPGDFPQVIEHDEQTIRDTLEQWETSGDGFPVGIIALSGFSTMYLMHYLVSHGISCPDDISVVGFDNLDALRLMVPSPTRVATFPRTIGRKAMKRLVEKLNSQDVDDVPHKVVIPVELMAGSTVRTSHLSSDESKVDAANSD
ncbi:LacI family DNA-binding transcriptional regulator [Phycisphaerales bacterium AB-hyl4]|uniref:LacI family DNA-binding transcriptional regulator n=1 Tax=Natronomicrosphaera hydrolytica TaxID=3242702 RepID=A0ABV4U6T3_9BACT